MLTIAAGTIGAVATVAVLGGVGAFDHPNNAHPVSVHLPSGTADAARVAAQVIPGIAAVITTVDGNERRGSGIAVGPHEILTTTSVVDGTVGSGALVEVCLANGHRHTAREVGRDPMTGLVLLKVPGLSMTPARLVNADNLRAGDWIAAIGRTATSGPWVTSGVVTAVGEWSTDSAGTSHAGMITTNTEFADVARGGALVDERGRVVGILAGTTAPARGVAMPSDVANNVATQLAAKGWVSHGALGLRATDTRASGPSVTDVTAGASADTAGIKVGDRVIAIDAVSTPDTATLVYQLHRRTAGQRVRVTVVRGTRTVRLTAVLDGAIPPTSGSTPPSSSPAEPLAALTGSARG